MNAGSRPPPQRSLKCATAGLCSVLCWPVRCALLPCAAVLCALYAAVKCSVPAVGYWALSAAHSANSERHRSAAVLCVPCDSKRVGLQTHQ